MLVTIVHLCIILEITLAIGKADPVYYRSMGPIGVTRATQDPAYLKAKRLRPLSYCLPPPLLPPRPDIKSF